jgi:hypothetical protein
MARLIELGFSIEKPFRERLKEILPVQKSSKRRRIFMSTGSF